MGDWIARAMGYDRGSGPEDDLCFTPDLEPIFNENRRGERAIERMKEILPYCPQGVFNFDYPDGVAVMEEGTSAMTISWLDMWPGLEATPYAGKFGYTISPTDNVVQHTIGGWSLYINAYAKESKQTEAYKFLAWMLEGPAFEMIRDAGEVTLLYKPDLAKPEVKAQVPMLDIWDDIERFNGTFIPLVPYNLNNPNEIQRIMYEEVVRAVHGDKSPKAAMDDAYDRCRRALRLAQGEGYIASTMPNRTHHAHHEM
jgi:ABC-type glycerol-3-phosphate transport system substrate-binding protein